MDVRAANPVAVVRDLLAGGPLPASEFRKKAYAGGVPVKLIGKAARQAGAECRRVGPPGKDGWVWIMTKPDDGIITRPGRSGFYAHVYCHGKEVQKKLGDTLEEATGRMAELRKQLDEQKAAEPPKKAVRPPREFAVPKPLHDQLAEIGRQLFRLIRNVKELEEAIAP